MAAEMIVDTIIDPKLVIAVKGLLKRGASLECCSNALIDTGRTILAFTNLSVTALIPLIHKPFDMYGEITTAPVGPWQLLAAPEAQRSAWEYAHGEDGITFPETAYYGEEVAELTPADCALLAHVASAAETGGMRPILNGVHLKSTNEGQLEAAAADGFRLHVGRMGTSIDLDGVTVPAELAVILGKLKRHALISLKDDGNGVLVDVRDEPRGPVVMRLLSRTIGGAFPDYRQIIPVDTPYTDSAAAGVALSRAQAASERRKAADRAVRPGAIVKMLPDHCYQLVGISEQDEMCEQVFNPAYVAGAVKGLSKAETVTFHMTGKRDAPMRLTTADERFTAVVMPMSLATR